MGVHFRLFESRSNFKENAIRLDPWSVLHGFLLSVNEIAISAPYFDDKSMGKLCDKILDRKNIEQAYLELADRLDESRKTHRLRGIDSVSLSGIETSPSALLDRVEHELRDMIPCAPAIQKFIPKPDGSKRSIYVYSIADRVKSQAIERQLVPLVEAHYSTSLFSYRPGKSSHQAARTVIRRYLRRYDQDYFARSDVAKYTDTMDHQILKEKLSKIVRDDDALRRINLFVGNTVIKNWDTFQLQVGLVQGVGLIGLFYNVFLTEVDLVIERLVEMYRRVGDDMFLADRDESRLYDAWGTLRELIREHKLSLHLDKTQVGRNSIDFDYLGYSFHGGKVQIKSDSVAKLLQYYRSRLRWIPISLTQKMNRLRKIIHSNRFELHRKGVDFLFSHRFATDEEQIHEISNEFYRILTRYFFRDYTSQRQAQVRKMTAELPVASLSKLYYLITHGKASLQSLAIPRSLEAAS